MSIRTPIGEKIGNYAVALDEVILPMLVEKGHISNKLRNQLAHDALVLSWQNLNETHAEAFYQIKGLMSNDKGLVHLHEIKQLLNNLPDSEFKTTLDTALREREETIAAEFTEVDRLDETKASITAASDVASSDVNWNPIIFGGMAFLSGGLLLSFAAVSLPLLFVGLATCYLGYGLMVYGLFNSGFNHSVLNQEDPYLALKGTGYI